MVHLTKSPLDGYAADDSAEEDFSLDLVQFNSDDDRLSVTSGANDGFVKDNTPNESGNCFGSDADDDYQGHAHPSPCSAPAVPTSLCLGRISSRHP